MQFYWLFVFMTFVLFSIAVISTEHIRDVSIVLGLLNILLSLYMKQISLQEHNQKLDNHKEFMAESHDDTDTAPFKMKNMGDGVTPYYDPNYESNQYPGDYRNRFLGQERKLNPGVAYPRVIGTGTQKDTNTTKPQKRSIHSRAEQYDNMVKDLALPSNVTSQMSEETIAKLGGTAATLKQRLMRRGAPTFDAKKLEDDKWRNKKNKDYNLQRRGYNPEVLREFFESELHENERLPWWGN